ncbi:unnamed protein product [Ilex paraguariensis]|uniref:F-box domain-containing protein n=1 Tax=Ilex paraguariensis TaxID=185542 RepID=A0ABC8TSX1_9AQUA
MEKKAPITFPFAQHKYLKKCNHEEDRLSRLPCEILVTILSRLAVKEAARTSVLSRGWENLWKYSTGVFNFDDVEAVRGLIDRNGLRVSFDLDESYGLVLDKWINFAIMRRVAMLELDLLTFNGIDRAINNSIDSYTNNYTFLMFPSRPLFSPSFASLTSLILKSVNVTEEVLSYFLCNCPLLEDLRVRGSGTLVNLKVVGPTLKLKYLEINECYKLKHLEIQTPNIVSFTNHGPEISMPFKNVSRLSMVSLGEDYCGLLLLELYRLSLHHSQLETNIMDFEFCQLLLVLSRLETLRLYLEYIFFIRKELPGLFPLFLPLCSNFHLGILRLSNLKHLEMKVIPLPDENILYLSCLLKASPHLHRFSMQIIFTWTSDMKLSGLQPYCSKDARKSTEGPYQCLKVVEFVGCAGHQTDGEFARHLLWNAVSLEKMIIDPRPRYLGREFETGIEVARKRAKELETELPLNLKGCRRVGGGVRCISNGRLRRGWGGHDGRRWGCRQRCQAEETGEEGDCVGGSKEGCGEGEAAVEGEEWAGMAAGEAAGGVGKIIGETLSQRAVEWDVLG